MAAAAAAAAVATPAACFAPPRPAGRAPRHLGGELIVGCDQKNDRIGGALALRRLAVHRASGGKAAGGDQVKLEAARRQLVGPQEAQLGEDTPAVVRLDLRP